MPIPVAAPRDIIATPDLASYLRTTLDSSADLIVALANGLVGDVVGDFDPLPTRVTTITLEVAARAWRNPQGYSSETIDDYTYRRDADTRQAGVYLTDTEAAELRRLVGKGGRSAYTVGLSSPLDLP